MKNKKLLTILTVVLLILSTQIMTFAAAVPESTATKAGQTVTVTFEYKQIGGINGTFTYSNPEMLESVDITVNDAFTGIAKDDSIAYFATSPADFVATLTIKIADTAKAGDKCEITLEYETSIHGEASDTTSKDTAVIVIEEDAEEELDYTALEEQIDIAEGLNEDDYTEDSWAAMEEVLEEAKALIGNADTQEEIDEMTKALEEAIKALVPKTTETEIDYSELEEQIDIAEGLNENDYTPESWEEMIKVLEEAKALIGNAETQEEVDEMTQALKDAIAALKSKVPETGDTTSLFGLAALAVFSVAGIAVVIKKRKVTVE